MSDTNQIIRLSFDDLSSKRLKEIKQLLRKINGERLVVAQKTDPIYLALSNKDVLIGFAMLSKYAPENHFKQPGMYLYNFITDTTIKKEERCGYQLLRYIEQDAERINLDVEHTNLHAFKFFVRSNYKVVGKYERVNIKAMMVSDVDNAANQMGLTEIVNEMKSNKKGLVKVPDIEPILNDQDIKKTIYISMSKVTIEKIDSL